ncbi:bifunctional biotin--[acetyl-CoA-carboxylase] ligase/biotin operon repressor BirA [Ferrimonas balearica]|uniref:bifunctional biotin--[acetyl-CoA-carboxylase] ligase/biotin operon repressor BirA n=1 Tax=Ferrimonas balearica TaxID=44012 RepID=UPI001C5771E6|nr:bifunctional biotin--[acetyl-CoA-carboxylase] ligase/biotin operon repressor BirA [Ferrimonas balearica]MBW3141605.1 bifunctional biotin--[acetyl-CoA-carboxylase] ligase/biotin operon repressor BirA [Ferrimonas balearica]MBY6108651.1 bifunctional biotin--[acetyl-CoA-carboxylase] ligase/biotin operon repressor BirA [Ferrimonas balearica]
MLSTIRQQLIAALADGQFHSGAHLAEQLGVSRAAIHNHIEALSALGLDLYRVKGKGYRLAQPLSLLSADHIGVAERPAPLHLLWQVDSTNAFLLARAKQCRNGEACLAEMQTGGRGRRGRTWVSPIASHLYLSYFWRLEQGLAAAGGLSLAVGVMLCEALESLGVSGLTLKWPNDIYLNGRKLAGILVEVSGQQGEACELVIGCGVNVTMPESMAALIDQPWADLAGEGIAPSRSELARRVLEHLDAGMQDFELEGLAPFVARWLARDQFADTPVKLLLGNQEVTGVARGIDPQGHLLLALPDGTVKRFAGGELSLRPRD